jgi:hypothetical protein
MLNWNVEVRRWNAIFAAVILMWFTSTRLTKKYAQSVSLRKIKTLNLPEPAIRRMESRNNTS